MLKNRVKYFLWKLFEISINGRLPLLKAVLISPPFNPCWSDISLKLNFCPSKILKPRIKFCIMRERCKYIPRAGFRIFIPFKWTNIKTVFFGSIFARYTVFGQIQKNTWSMSRMNFENSSFLISYDSYRMNSYDHNTIVFCKFCFWLSFFLYSLFSEFGFWLAQKTFSIFLGSLERIFFESIFWTRLILIGIFELFLIATSNWNFGHEKFDDLFCWIFYFGKLKKMYLQNSIFKVAILNSTLASFYLPNNLTSLLRFKSENFHQQKNSK